jgi:DNA-binding MarR family transcriptional regulator
MNAPPLDDELAALLMRWFAMSMAVNKGKSVRAMLALQNKHTLSSAMVVVMHIVAFDGAQTMTALSERTGLSTSAMSHLLQRLVDQGLMERTEDAGDRRVKNMALTPKGHAILSAIVRERFDDLRTSVASITVPTKLALREVITTVVEELGASAPDPLHTPCPNARTASESAATRQRPNGSRSGSRNSDTPPAVTASKIRSAFARPASAPSTQAASRRARGAGKDNA